MNKSCHYMINKHFVVYEQIDAELTVINLQKGYYFIGKDSAIDIFLSLENAQTISDIVGQIMTVYSVQETVVREEVASLVDSWLKNDLISEVDDASLKLISEPRPMAELKPWTQPIFIAFDDIRDLLLLDPIHETDLDEQGWPVAGK